MTVRLDSQVKARVKEEEVILASLQAYFKGGLPPDKILADLAAVDGDKVVHLIQKHKVGYFLYSILKKLPLSNSLLSLQRRLKCRIFSATSQNLYLNEVLGELKDLFYRCQIPFIPLKGPLLSMRLYGHLGARESSDLDLWIPSSRALQVARLLTDQGFVAEIPLPSGLFSILVSLDHGLAFHHHQRGVTVDLHWRASPRYFPFPFSFQQAWRESRKMKVRKRTFFCLSPEDQFLFLAVHGAKHLWCQLSMIVDLGQLIERGEIHWPTVWKKGKRWKVFRRARLALELARAVLEIELPEGAKLDGNSAAGVENTLEKITADLFGREELLFHPRSRLAFYFATFDNWWEVAKNFFFYLVTPNEEDVRTFSLPPSLAFLYPLLRPLRLLWQK